MFWCSVTEIFSFKDGKNDLMRCFFTDVSTFVIGFEIFSVVGTGSSKIEVSKTDIILWFFDQPFKSYNVK